MKPPAAKPARSTEPGETHFEAQWAIAEARDAVVEAAKDLERDWRGAIVYGVQANVLADAVKKLLRLEATDAR